MQPGKAFLGGVLGGAAMSLVFAIARGFGVPINLEMILGSMITVEVGVFTWILGFVVHLLVSGLIGLAYGAGFEHVTHLAGAGTGALLSIVHILVGGLMMGWVGNIHPLMPEFVAPPGAFMAMLGGIGVALFVLTHVLYGAMVGGVYRPILVEHRREAHA